MPRAIQSLAAMAMLAVLACSRGPMTAPSSTGSSGQFERVSSQLGGTVSAAQTSTCPDVSPTSQWQPGSPLLEVRGTGQAAELWALTEPPIARTDVKIVWRMTGSGALRVVAADAQGRQVEPTEGPTPHEGSKWNRPGDEWGTIFYFPDPGCWTIEAHRDSGSGRVVIEVK